MSDRDRGDGTHRGAETREAAARVVHEVASGARTAASLAAVLRDSGLDERDRAFVTELAHGAVRMRRSCDHFVDAHTNRAPDAEVRALLQVGVYQMVFLGTPPHAAVSATVAAARPKVRGFVNAVLRKVATDVERGGSWPSLGVELSYPDWLIDAFIDDLGEDDALDALAAMNDGEQAAPRTDGYVQGASSLAVVDEVPAKPGDLVLDLCAAPGGKTTALASSGATVVGLEPVAARVEMLSAMTQRFGDGNALATRGDATAPPFPAGRADHVLVDAPCSGWGALGRRSDARWRLGRGDANRLAALQLRILAAAAELVKPGGSLVYSVCTVSRAETIDVAAAFDDSMHTMAPAALIHTDRWRPLGNGGLLLPQDNGSDGMAVFRWTRQQNT